jgi:hypothetical protein
MKEPIEDIYGDEPDADPDFDDTQPPDPDDAADGDLDAAPQIAHDAYDDDEGYLIELEDIASVAWEAVRAYRAIKGNNTVRPWMHASQAERHTMVRITQQIIAKSGHVCGDPEHQLIYAIVQILARPA